MPVTPSSIRTNNPVTANWLNQSLYSIDGSYFNSTGVFFHSNRPLLVETLIEGATRIPAPANGAITEIGGANGDGLSLLDNAALFGTGSDGPADEARFQSSGAVAPGSSGISGQPGGWNLFIGFVPLGPFSSTSGTFGVCWLEEAVPTEPLLDIGPMVPPSNVYGNCGFAVDLIQRFPNLPGQIFSPGVFAQDTNGQANTVVSNTVTSVGITARYSEIWFGVCNGFGGTVASLPTPLTAVTAYTPLSSASLNQTITQMFTLLNSPPILNAQLQATTSIAANTVTVVPFTQTPLADNYSRFSTATTTYTVPLSGLYFCHATVIYSTGFNSGQAVAGFQVNGTNYFGGVSNATPSASQNTGAAVTKFLDLQAGDTVKVVSVTSANTAFGNANVSHFIMTWLCPLNTSVQHWTPPDVTGLQLAAGTPPESVTSQYVNPYFAGQSAAGWSGFNGTVTVPATPAAGAPYQYAAQYVNNGTSAGAIEGTGTFTAYPGQVVYLSAWGWTGGTQIQAGFDFTLNGTYATTVVQTFTVPSATWTRLSMAATVPSAAVNGGYPRVGTPTASGATVQTSGIIAGFQQPLSAVLDRRLAQDVNFVYNKPYLTVHQTAATTSLSVNAAHSVPMTVATGLVHGSLGDNYGGWNSAANCYTAPVSGWYLAMTEVCAASVATANSGNSLRAGFSVPTSGGITAPTSPQAMPDWYQQLMVSNAWTYPTGAVAIGTYYLQAGETIAPSAEYLSGTASTWSTDVTHGFLSHFDLIWMSS